MRTFHFLGIALFTLSGCASPTDSVLSTGAPLEPECATPAPSGRLEAASSGLCVGSSAGTAAGAKLVQTACSSALEIELEALAGSTRLRVRGSDQCVEMPGATTAPYAQFQLATCNESVSQKFTVIDHAEERSFQAAASGLCLDVGSNSTAPGAPMVQWECHLEPHQRFSLRSEAAPPTDPPPANAVNSVDTMLGDMQGVNDMELAGNLRFGFAQMGRPGTLVMGNTPRGSNTPSWWNPGNSVYKSNALWRAMMPWHVVFNGVGNAATNTRVQMGRMRVYLKSKTTRAWTTAFSMDGSGGENYALDISSPLGAADMRNEADGTVSVLTPANAVFHGWGSYFELHAPEDIAAVVVTLRARLVVDSPARPDDRTEARYLMHVGGDYFPDMNTRVSAFAPVNWNPGIGVSRAKLVTSEWQAFNYVSVTDGTLQEPGGGITESELRAEPPPVE